MIVNFNCRVCGLSYEDPPWGMDGKTPNYEICNCCGVEFGYEDINYKSVKKYRENWLKGGCRWFNVKYKPIDWRLDIQLSNISKEFK